MALTEQQIKVYHCTRLPDIDTIKELGLIFPDERHFQYIIDSFHKYQVSEKIIKKITSNYEAREKSISFFYDKSEIQMYDRFFGLFGGEQLHYSLDTTKKDEYRHAIRIGRPVLIEFWIPFEWIQEVFREHLVKTLIMYWIKTDILNEDNVVFNLEGKTNHEIPPTQIRNIYYIKDTFDYTENW